MIRFVRNFVELSKVSSKNRLQLVRTMHSLVKNQAFVNGQWTNAGDNKCFNVTNPANNEVVGAVPDMNAADVEKAIDCAYDAFHSKSWQSTTGKERSGLLKVRLGEMRLEEFRMTSDSSRNGSVFLRAINKRSQTS